MKTDESMIHFTAGTRQPCSIDALAIARISVVSRPPRLGVKPTSRITAKASANITTSTAPLSRNGTPSEVSWATYPPTTEPVSMATPVTTCPFAKTESRLPVNPVA